MTFFGERDSDFMGKIVALAQTRICEEIGMTEEDFEDNTADVVIAEKDDGIFTVSFIDRIEDHVVFKTHEIDIDANDVK